MFLEGNAFEKCRLENGSQFGSVSVLNDFHFCLAVPTMIEVAPTMMYIFVHCARVLVNLCFSCNKETDNEAPISAETSRR